MTSYVGVDLAWGERNRTGVAVLAEDGRLVASGSVRTDDEIDAVFCAYLAWLWANDPEQMTVLGDVTSGDIVTVAPRPPGTARVPATPPPRATDGQLGDAEPHGAVSSGAGGRPLLGTTCGPGEERWERCR